MNEEMDKERKIKALLNLEEIQVYEANSFSSSSCGAPCFFIIECEERHGYTEDPDLSGVIFKVLDTKREGDEVIIKMKAKIQAEENENPD